MVCAERLLLLDKYREATSALFSAVTSLGSTSGEERQKALALSKAARAKCVMTRRDIP
jgi:hypothetical protein